MSTSLPRVEAFLSSLQEQSLFKSKDAFGSILWYIAFYQTRAPSRERAFRAAGFVLLFLSISLPFITQLSPTALQPLVASALAWVIALGIASK